MEQNIITQDALDKREATKRIPLSIEHLRELLFLSTDISVRRNVISGDIDVIGNLALAGESLDVPPTKKFETLVTLIHSECRQFFTGCNENTIRRYLEVIAEDERYNPLLNEIINCKWDGIDRIGELFDILDINEDELSCTLVRKWLHQGICLLNNDETKPIGADGMLVLCGAQGVGKTSFFRKIAIRPEWFGEGLTINQYDKDTTRRVVNFWVSELGEVESTLKGDIASLKAFITSPVDIYRLPYAQSDTNNVRRTNLCATCNTLDFLVDQTGNRRFWTVPVSEINLEMLGKLDPLQLWAQIYHEYAGDLQGFRLTKQERDLLEERNSAHQKKLPYEDEILDILAEGEEHPEWWRYTTITNFKDCYPSLRNCSAAKIAKVLQKIGIEQMRKRIGGKPNADRAYRLPITSPNAITGG